VDQARTELQERPCPARPGLDDVTPSEKVTVMPQVEVRILEQIVNLQSVLGRGQDADGYAKSCDAHSILVITPRNPARGVKGDIQILREGWQSEQKKETATEAGRMATPHPV
jgi:hypothetical protein